MTSWSPLYSLTALLLWCWYLWCSSNTYFSVVLLRTIHGADKITLKLFLNRNIASDGMKPFETLDSRMNPGILPPLSVLLVSHISSFPDFCFGGMQDCGKHLPTQKIGWQTRMLLCATEWGPKLHEDRCSFVQDIALCLLIWLLYLYSNLHTVVRVEPHRQPAWQSIPPMNRPTAIKTHSQ